MGLGLGLLGLEFKGLGAQGLWFWSTANQGAGLALNFAPVSVAFKGLVFRV